jgi:hypothetical protein
MAALTMETYCGYTYRGHTYYGYTYYLRGIAQRCAAVAVLGQRVCGGGQQLLGCAGVAV